jgi:hypothetical protein
MSSRKVSVGSVLSMNPMIRVSNSPRTAGDTFFLFQVLAEGSCRIFHLAQGVSHSDIIFFTNAISV